MDAMITYVLRITILAMVEDAFNRERDSERTERKALEMANTRLWKQPIVKGVMSKLNSFKEVPMPGGLTVKIRYQ